MTDTPQLEALYHDLVALLGDANVSRDQIARERASKDGSHLSPVIQLKLPLGLADLVAYPTDVAQVPQIVALAYRYGVPITPRGKGTANYGQTIPMQDGLVIDTSRLRKLIEVGEGFLTAEAGVTMLQVEQAANKHGQEVLMYPSTVQSSLGGFLAGGSGGTGSIEYGMLHEGFVLALDVVPATEDAQILHLEGDDTIPYLHSYGTTGIIVRATVKLAPLRDWVAVYAAFDDYPTALTTIRPLMALDVTPRLLSADNAVLAAGLPKDPEALPAGKASVRGIFDRAVLPEVERILTEAGGAVTAERDQAKDTFKLSTISYNHAIEWLQKAHPGKYFHIEVIGWNLIDRLDEVEAVYPGGMLHLEGQQERPIGMLAGEFESEDAVYEAFAKLEELGVGYHNPHQWYVDYEPERSIELGKTVDPKGLLNPGKLVLDPPIVTGSQR